MKKDKILVNERANVAKQKIEALHRAIGILNNELLPLFKTLEIGELTTELMFCALNDSSVIAGMVEVQAQNDVSQMNNPAIKQTLIEATNKQIQHFIAGVEQIHGRLKIDASFFPYFEVLDGRVQIVKDADQQIKEECKIYIETEKEHALYEAMNRFADAFNEVDGAFGEMAKEQLKLRRIGFLMDFFKFNSKGALYLNNEIDFRALAHRTLKGMDEY